MAKGELAPRERWSEMALKYRDTYAKVPRRGFIQKTFGLSYCLDAWRADGFDVPDGELNAFFQFDPWGKVSLGELGWVEAELYPRFPVVVLEDRGETELVQDFAGRGVLYFKGRRNGFMPEYVTHPVTDRASWEKNVKWRLDYQNDDRLAALAKQRDWVEAETHDGKMVTQCIIGGYMYLRSMIGPEPLPYLFYDDPKLIHDCMATWLDLADKVTAYYQEALTFDELFIAEDICYKNGPLISPDMIREFLFPYYRQLIHNIRARQLDPKRTLYIHLDTDGDCRSVLELYRDEVGVTVFSPFEVASGCDVVAIGKRYPEMILQGGFDKRILAAGKDAIDREVDRIFPVMYERGGYIPTSDHGVPAEVNWRDYVHYRKRCLEFI
ncbi:MAG: uroporphyrinogen decarboxylase family protein [Kiritimatiellaeota bacterium]|nr:uroporphyrinogen decarboxylase family protein [Kiritimatiellota bacterium]